MYMHPHGWHIFLYRLIYMAKIIILFLITWFQMTNFPYFTRFRNLFDLTYLSCFYSTIDKQKGNEKQWQILTITITIRLQVPMPRKTISKLSFSSSSLMSLIIYTSACLAQLFIQKFFMTIAIVLRLTTWFQMTNFLSM